MIYTLMQKNEPVIKLDINGKYGRVRRVIQIENLERLPLSVKYKDESDTLEDAVGAWMHRRNIPKNREGIKEFLSGFQGDSIQELSLKSLGLNLSDQYWFKPEGSQAKWEDVNFFQNNFIGKPVHMSLEAETPAPDFSTNGKLPKYWAVKNGKRVLLKAGKGPLYQEPINEVIASRLLARAGIPHVEYSMEVIDNTPWSECLTFVNTSTEYIPAYEVLNVVKAQENEGPYDHFMRCIEILGIPVTKKEIDTMLQFDYLINNRDRHWGNFGFIRNVDTLEIKGLAPLFDNGSSLWFSQPVSFIEKSRNNCLAGINRNLAWLQKLDDDFIGETIMTEMSDSPFLDGKRIQSVILAILTIKRVLS